MADTKRSRIIIRRILLIILVALLLMAVIVLLYFRSYYHGDSRAEAALSNEASSDNVRVEDTGECWIFDGPGNECALIFYPGAKVEAEAYAPLMRKIASEGTDCFLCDMPLNFALFDIDKAEDILEKADYDHWYIAGHSLGGVAAAKLCEEEGDKFDGLILLASYSSDTLEQPEVLCIYGTEDKVLNKDSYNEAVSEERYSGGIKEIIIHGGNHAQFGDYGLQKGDGAASVSVEGQQKQTADAIIEMIHTKD